MAYLPPPPPSREDTIHLTPYSSQNAGYRSSNHPYGSGCQPGWSGYDPRSSSTQSLRPEGSVDGKRTLLLIYVHGFLGDETSFKSFPAHVHNLLTITLAETHVVHSKIYPRYKSRKAIDYARDDFSNWLCPHESPNTDVVFLGHSLGGILAAEVALLSPYSPHARNPLRHRILGIVAFDTPFLGMHPGVVGSGIKSLFRSNPEKGNESTQSFPPPSPGYLSPSSSLSIRSDDDLLQVPSNDPNFNPSFANDIHIPQRSGIQKALYFVNKHSGGLTSATKEYVLSHFEFGGCLADYAGLKRRYDKIRSLEDVDEQRPQRDGYGRPLPRVRFVNYYTASTGRIKPSESIAKQDADPIEIEMKDMSFQPRSSTERSRTSRSISPSIRISGKIPREEDTGIQPNPSEDGQAQIEPRHENASAKSSLQSTEDQSVDGSTLVASASTTSDHSSQTTLPQIHPLPSPPPLFDATKHTDKDDLKVAQKEHARQVKAFERAKKDRDKCIRDREKLALKREKAALKEQERQQKLAAKEAEKRSKVEKQNEGISRSESLKRQSTLNPELYDRHLEREAKQSDINTSPSAQATARKKQRDRKFCALPAKRPDGSRDEKWVRVYMDGVDEVAAHTSLFEPTKGGSQNHGETYERLVGDTAARIEEWVSEERTRWWLEQEREGG